MTPDGDPELRRLRWLLRRQVHAAALGRYEAVAALAQEVRTELARPRVRPPADRPRAEAAHLQARLEQLLRQGILAHRQRLLAAAAREAYARWAPRG